MRNSVTFATIVATTVLFCFSSTKSTAANAILPIQNAQERLLPLFDMQLYSEKDPSISMQKYETLFQPFLKAVGDNRIEAARQGFCHLQSVCAEGRGDLSNIIGMDTLLARLQITKQELVTIAAPYLDTKDDCLQEILYTYLERREQRSRDPRQIGFDFSIHIEILKSSIAKNEEPSVGLMGYMYQLEPGPAVLQMTAIDSEFSTIRNLLSIAHPDTTPAYRRPPKKCLLLNFQSEWDTKKLRTEFERLSRNQKWWVRLWVIETLKQLPELEEESILEGFKTDPNESIRERLLKADPIPREYRPSRDAKSPKSRKGK